MKYEAPPQSQACQGLGAAEVLIEGITCLACMTPERGKHMMQVGFMSADSLSAVGVSGC